jgi:sirohydrochlorin ferrochelatase
MRAILLIDHGSRLKAANDLLHAVAELLRELVGGRYIVEVAHMELAEPDIAAGVRACVAAGASEVIAMPYMLAPGRHALQDIPQLVEEALQAHPGVALRVAEPLGRHRKLAEVVLQRCESVLAPAASPSGGH